MKNKETYYKKVLISTGEVPEQEGWYDTNVGNFYFSDFARWHENEDGHLSIEDVEYWLKPVPSPQQEAERFAEWVASNFKRVKGANKTFIYRVKDFISIGAADATIKDYWTISELYTKFKEKGESKEQMFRK